MRIVALLAIVIMTTASQVFGQGGHEYSPIQEAAIEYKNWSLPSLDKAAPAVDLREWSKDKKLVLVVYFAPWCGNWKYEAPVVARLHEKYKKDGFDVVAVSEYAPSDDTRLFMSENEGAYTVVVESEDRAARDKTTHFGYRKISGDGRNWGSPYNVFLVPSKLEKKGDLLISKTWVVNGELIETEAESFIRERLGLAPLKAEDKGTE